MAFGRQELGKAEGSFAGGNVIMRPAVAFATIALLLCSCVRLAWQVRRELGQRQSSLAEQELLAADGNMIGIDLQGRAVEPNPDGSGRLLPADRLLAFVVHRNTAGHDIAYWNQVLSELRKLPTAQRVGFWGICDSGSECRHSEALPAFPIVGYLEPYEMRAMAVADSREQALLFHGGNRAAVPVTIASNPRAQAQLILNVHADEGH